MNKTFVGFASHQSGRQAVSVEAPDLYTALRRLKALGYSDISGLEPLE